MQLPSSSHPAAAIPSLFETYLPRQVCMRFEADVIWLHVISDSLIAISYFSIPLALIYFVRRRDDIGFNWIFLMFAAFITACGLTHVLSVVDIWAPAYRLDGIVKLATGLVSAVTAILLWRMIPRALTLPSLAGLRSMNESLAAEIRERRHAEERLQKFTGELEARVQERTADLQKANDERNRLLVQEQAARTEAEHANQMKDEFVGTLSHELRTPIAAILGWVTLLRRGGSEAELDRGLEVIARNVKTQQRMIDDLLDINRIASGKLLLELQAVNLATVVEAAIETVRPAAEARNIAIKSTFNNGAEPLEADPGRLQQILWNLLANAIKFTPEGGQIEVLVRQRAGGGEVVVRDTGCGIPVGFLPHVFERFRQADPTLTRSAGGLGLGLAIVKSLVELHGGSVEVRSEGEGKGAEFTIWLPRDKPPGEGSSAPAIPTGRPGEQPKLDGVEVLLVDDDPDIQGFVRRVLEAAGASVRIADSAAAALRAFAAAPPDVLISDIGMPGEDGYSLMRRIRALPPDAGGTVPAIAVTALARAEDRALALLAGYQQHLAKPVEPHELVRAVFAVVGSTSAS